MEERSRFPREPGDMVRARRTLRGQRCLESDKDHIGYTNVERQRHRHEDTGRLCAELNHKTLEIEAGYAMKRGECPRIGNEITGAVLFSSRGAEKRDANHAS